MPITKSAKKALRAGKRKRVFNQKRKADLKSTVKNARTATGSDARSVLSLAYQAIDKAVKRGIIKKNAAARKKSRLSKALKGAAKSVK